MKQQFEVIEVDNKTMTLQANPADSCHSCSAKGACGTGILSNYFKHDKTISKPLQQGVVIGDIVTLKIASSELFLRAFQLYMVPLLVLFFSTMMGMRLFPANELWHIGFGLFGFALSLLLLRYFVK